MKRNCHRYLHCLAAVGRRSCQRRTAGAFRRGRPAAVGGILRDFDHCGVAGRPRYSLVRRRLRIESHAQVNGTARLHYLVRILRLDALHMDHRLRHRHRYPNLNLLVLVGDDHQAGLARGHALHRIAAVRILVNGHQVGILRTHRVAPVGGILGDDINIRNKGYGLGADRQGKSFRQGNLDARHVLPDRHRQHSRHVQDTPVRAVRNGLHRVGAGGCVILNLQGLGGRGTGDVFKHALVVILETYHELSGRILRVGSVADIDSITCPHRLLGLRKHNTRQRYLRRNDINCNLF